MRVRFCLKSYTRGYNPTHMPVCMFCFMILQRSYKGRIKCLFQIDFGIVASIGLKRACVLVQRYEMSVVIWKVRNERFFL